MECGESRRAGSQPACAIQLDYMLGGMDFLARFKRSTLAGTHFLQHDNRSRFTEADFAATGFAASEAKHLVCHSASCMLAEQTAANR